MTDFAAAVLISVVPIPILLLVLQPSPTGYVSKCISGKVTTTGFQIFSAFACVSAAQPSSLAPLVYQGCFTSPADMKDLGFAAYQSPGYCQQLCVKQDKPVMGMSQVSHCWCGSMLPASSSKVSDMECNSECNGYNATVCESMHSHGRCLRY